MATVAVVASLWSLGCSRADTPSGPPRPDIAPVDSTLARHMLQRLNPHAWVGTAHNEAMNLVRATYSAKSLGGTNACGEFPLHRIVAAVPATRNRPGSAEQELSFVQLGLNVARCGIPATSTRLAAARNDLSPRALAAIDAINDAVDGTASAGALAVALYPAVQQATALDEPERTLVLSLAAVAQSSGDYWYAEFGGYTAAVFDQYGPCMASGAGIDACGGGLARRTAAPPTSMRAAGACTVPSIEDGMRGLIKTDIVGGLTAGMAAMFTAVLVPKAALLGAGGASAGRALLTALEIFECMYLK